MKKSNLSLGLGFVTLTAVVSFVITNIIAFKQVSLFGLPISAGFLLYPILYVTSDIVSEVYGYKMSRRLSWLCAVTALFVIGIFWLSVVLPPAESFTFQTEYSLVLGSAPLILIFSLTAFMLGDFVNDKIHAFMKRKHKEKYLFARLLGSSVVGEFVDGFLFVGLMAIIVWKVPARLWAITVFGNIIFGFAVKIVYETVLYPLTRKIIKTLEKYEAQNNETV